MANKIVFSGESGEAYTLDAQLAQGGQGMVLKAKDKAGKSFAVKWYHSYMANPTQRQQLKDLAVKGQPKISSKDIEFIWPLDMVNVPGQQSYGYAMPLYDSKKFVHYNRIINGKARQPRLDQLAKLSYLVCFALDAVHKEGYAYCDINLGNIQFDIDAGKIIVCDNDNVVVNNSNAQVMGVPEFMAPEVAQGSQPNAQSDLYSLGVLLYQMWMWEHPMDGALTEKVRCWDQPAKIKHYAKEPLFVHHPTDHRNNAEQSSVLALSLKRWQATCPTRLKELFTRTFTDGVKDPNKRPRLREWQACFMEIEANAMSCPSCSAVNIVEDKPAAEQTCFHCQNPLPVYLMLKINQGRSYLAVQVDAELRQHHCDTSSTGDKALTVLGRIESHPKQQGAFILRNQTNESWFYEHEGQAFRIEPTQARPLGLGGKIKIGTSEVDIVGM